MKTKTFSGLLAALFALCLCAAPAFAAMSDADFVELCEKGTAAEVEQALKDGANPNAENDEGGTALMAAAGSGNHETARALLTAGAAPNAQDGVIGLLESAPTANRGRVEVLAPRFGFDGFLLGAFIDGQWVTHDDLQENERYRDFRIWGGNECRVYRFGGPEGGCVATADPRDHQDDHPGETYTGPDTHTMPVQTPSGDLGLGDARLTVIGGHDAMPRKTEILPTDNAIYKEIVADYLSGRGLSGAKPNIAQLFRVDLDGDGTDEVLIAAQNVASGDERFSFAPDRPLLDKLQSPTGLGLPRAGEYSVILLRRVIGGVAKNIPLVEFISTKNAPEDADPFTDSAWVHRIAAVADLNGDGAMEIVTAEAFIRGLWYRVYETKDASARTVLENGYTGD